MQYILRKLTLFVIVHVITYSILLISLNVHSNTHPHLHISRPYTPISTLIHTHIHIHTHTHSHTHTEPMVALVRPFIDATQHFQGVIGVAIKKSILYDIYDYYDRANNYLIIMDNVLHIYIYIYI